MTRILSFLSLTPGSLLLGQLSDGGDIQAFTDLLFGEMAKASSSVGIGRYDEPRCIYTADTFRIPGNDRDKWRTIHLGIDLFMPARNGPYTPPSPAKSTVFANNTDPLDYRPRHCPTAWRYRNAYLLHALRPSE